MLDFPRWKVWSIVLLLLAGIAFAVPSLVPEAMIARVVNPDKLARINLGLDLSGGSYILLEGDTRDVARSRLTQMEETVRTELRRQDPKVDIGDISTSGGRVLISCLPVRSRR